MGKAQKLMLLNISGADWQQIHPLVDAGRMPVMARLIEEGCIGNLWAPQPLRRPIPAMTLATGQYPAKHRVFGDFLPDATLGARRLAPPDVKSAAIWDIVQAQGKTAVAVGWPGSHPAPKTGPNTGPLIISDAFAAATGESFDDWAFDPETISDPAHAADLSEARMHPTEVEAEMIGPFVPRLAEVDQDTDKRLAQYIAAFAQAMSFHSAATWAAEFTDWDFLAVNLGLVDVQSALFMQYQAPQMGHVTDTDHALYEGIVAGSYQFLDMLIERYLQLLPEGAHLMLTSDHGFQSGAGRPRPDARRIDAVTPQYRDFGMFSIWGPQAKPDGAIFGATIVDIVPTALAMLGLKRPDDLSGKVLQDAFSAPIPSETCAPVAAPTGGRPADKTQTAQLAKDLALVGYRVPRYGAPEIIESQLQTEALLSEARDLIARGRLETADKVLQRALELAPSNNTAHRLRFQCAVSRRDYALARPILEGLREIDPFATDLDIAEGELALGEKDTDAALAHFEAALDDVPLGSAGAQQLARIARGQLGAGAAEQAEATFRTALKQNGTLLSALTGLGETLARQKRFEEAIAVLRKSVANRSKQLDAQMLLARCYLAIKKFEDAERAIGIAIEIAPNFEPATTLLKRIRDQHAKHVILAAEARGS